MNTCVGCLLDVRLPPVLAARQKSPPETAAEGKFLTNKQQMTIAKSH